MRKKNSGFWILVYGLVMFLSGGVLSGCQTIEKVIKKYSFSSGLQDASAEQRSGGVRRLYVQSFSGQRAEGFQKNFYEALQKQGAFKITELLPSDFRNLGILRVKVLNYMIQDNQEPFLENGEKDTPEFIIRRNALISIQISLFEAETGKIIVKKKFSQPFQQVYFDQTSQNNRPDEREELARLTNALMQQIVSAILSPGGEEGYEFESGVSHGILAETFIRNGNGRLKKGIRQAKNGMEEKAVLTWNLTIFELDENQPPKIYMANKASAYYNIGVIYTQQEKWLKAAESFSKANRLNPNLKYAQAWGSSMHNWILKKENPPQKEKQKKIIKHVVKTRTKAHRKKKDARQREENRQLLLKPQLLWPFEPHIKKQFKDSEASSSITPTDRLKIEPIDIPE